MATDRSKTFRDLVEAAEQGDPSAQFELGRAHFRGEGAPLDRAEAERWLKRAVSGGHAVARIYLAELRGRPNQPLERNPPRQVGREQGFDRWLDGALPVPRPADQRRPRAAAADSPPLVTSPAMALRRLLSSRYLPATLLAGLLAYLLIRLAQTGTL